MTARAGMGTLIQRLRTMTAAGTADYSLGSQAHWTDDQLQTVLDSYRVDLNEYTLQPIPETIAGETAYHEYRVERYQNFEEASSGTIYWRVQNSGGTIAGTADYSVDYVDGVIRFNSDQEADLYYLRARSYNLPRAAADVWRQKAAHFAGGVDFQADDQRFNLSQKHSQALKMAEYYEKQSGGRSVKMYRGDLSR